MDNGYVRHAVVEPGNPHWVSLPIGADVKLDVDDLNR
jgi:hypothetical protein